MRFSGRKALRTRQDSKKLTGFSKMWKSGDTLRAFYPIYWDAEEKAWSMLVAAVWGHSVDYNAMSGLKRVFIPTNCELNDEGEPVGTDIAFQFARIAPLFVKGQYAQAIAEIEQKKADGKFPKDAMYKQALTKINKEFEVDDDGNIKKQPAISGLRFVISTECVAVTTTGDKCDAKLAKIVSQDLSDERLKIFNAILDKFPAGSEDGEMSYLEIEYTFGTEGDRKKDGKCTPIGVSKNESVEVKFADQWEQIKGLIAMLPDRSESIEKHNSSFKPCDEGDIISAIALYSVLNAEYLDVLLDGDDAEDVESKLLKNATILSQLEIKLDHEEFMEEIHSEAKKIQEAEAKEAAARAKAGDSAPTLDDVLKQQESEITKEDIEEAKRETGAEDMASAEDAMIAAAAAVATN